MLDQLIKIFAQSHPLTSTQEQFSEMLGLVQEMIQTASKSYWGLHLTKEERQALQDTDVQVNKLQRTIRKEVIVQLSGPTTADVPHGLLLMSLVKDAERLGDYAKNLAELHEVCDRSAGDLPEGSLRDRLREIADFVENLSREATKVYADADQTRAQQLATEGRRVARKCDELISAVAGSDLSAAVAVDMALAARYYKRIGGHLLNLLSSVVMPLHKLDYFEDVAPVSTR